MNHADCGQNGGQACRGARGVITLPRVHARTKANMSTGGLDAWILASAREARNQANFAALKQIIESAPRMDQLGERRPTRYLR